MLDYELAMHSHGHEKGEFCSDSVLRLASEFGLPLETWPQTWVRAYLNPVRPIPTGNRSTRKRRISFPQDSVQSLITAILTGSDTYTVPSSQDEVRRMLFDLAKYSRDLEKEIDTLRRVKSIEPHSSTTSPPSSTLATEVEAPPPRSEIDLDEALGDRLEGLTLKHYHGRHFGKSSHFMLLSTALDMRDDLNGKPQPISVHMKRSDFWDLKPVSFLPLCLYALQNSCSGT